MLFTLVEIRETGNSVQYIFSNDGTFHLNVESTTTQLFVKYKNYDIKVLDNLPFEYNIFITNYCYSHLGVVVKKTTRYIQIMSGNTRWSFPRIMCSYKPGTPVWINVVEVPDTNIQL